MEVKYYSDRDPRHIQKHLLEAGDIEIITIQHHNNRIIVWYRDKPKPGRKPRAENKEIENG